ncbi:hypothetical protein [Streptomyces sp. NPDC093097]|uniref:hypothetical protein n=1 Tax=Streptomyces sp. NPDC093097 TaxID=3366027 RepID=UPI0037F75489
MKTAKRITIAGTLSAVALGALVVVTPVAQAAQAHDSSRCNAAVAQTKQHLTQAGRSSTAQDWRVLRSAAQVAVSTTPRGGAAIQALRNDISNLDKQCATSVPTHRTPTPKPIPTPTPTPHPPVPPAANPPAAPAGAPVARTV